MNSVLREALNILPKATMQGQQVQACCPAHNDKNPSLSLTEKDGKILVKCFAGCDQETVIDHLETMGLSIRNKREHIQGSLKHAPIKVGKSKPDFDLLIKRQPDFVYEYLDALGENILGYVVRWNTPEGKEIRPITPWKDENQKVFWRLQGFPEPRPLYGLDLLTKHPEKTVLIVEGEKAADAARLNKALKDYVAITWVGGSNSVAKTDWSRLQGRKIVIWPDNDNPGIKAAKQIEKILREINT